MIIAVGSDSNKVSKHFGHCKNFNIYEVNDNKIINEKNLESPGHDSGRIPEFLEEQGTEVVISGGMGQGAIDRLGQKNIKIVMCDEEYAKEAVQLYIKGELISKDNVCGHNHEGHNHHHKHDEKKGLL